MPITSMVELYQENEQARERFKALASPFSSLECSLFAVMLTSRSLESHSKLFGRSTSQVTPEDWAAFEDAITHFDDVVHILRVLPISMLLVFRNINIVRSINRELGTPVNRFNIMARSAIEGAGISTDPHSWTWRARLSSWLEAKAFDCRLHLWSLHTWCTVKYIQVLRLMGWLPEEAQVLEEFMLA